MPDVKLKVSSEELGADKGVLLRWCKAVGDWVRKNEELIVLGVDGKTITIRAPAQGVLKKILVEENESFDVDTVLGILRTVMGGT